MDPQQLFTRLKALTATLTAGQVTSMALAFALVVGIVAGSAWWLRRPTYALLFADMDPESAGDVITNLKTMKVDYQLDEGGRGIRVPLDRVDELRLDLAKQGLPQSGRPGFEIFDKIAFGETEFQEQIRYRRALEGEISRTIGTLSEVSGARVHIAAGKDSLFGESRPAKASIVLKLKGQRALAPSTVNGISNLVAASVEGLRPESVVIIDTFGRPLARPQDDDTDPLGAAQTERQQRLERDMAARVVALLEPVVGSSRVRVNVAVRLNPQTREETQERWDPDSPVVRSKQTSADASGNVPPPGGAIAGARANTAPPVVDPKTQPPGGAPAAPAAPTPLSASRTAETTNYEVSKVTTRVIQPPGDIARLSVAVIVDDDQTATKDQGGQVQVKRNPRKPEDLTKLHDLVAAAVGFDMNRGDQLTVENVSFEETVTEDPPPPTVLDRMQQYSPQIWEASRILAIVLIGIIALLFVVRPMLPARAPATAVQVATAAPAVPGAPIKTVEDLQSEIEAQLDADASAHGSQRLPVLARRATTLGQRDPENVAKVLRGWITDPER